MVWAIWFCRNKIRFDSKQIHFNSITSMISASVAITRNISSGSMSADMQDFMILKKFAISCKPSKVHSIIQVVWCPPPCYWVKCNTDGAAKGVPGPTT